MEAIVSAVAFSALVALLLAASITDIRERKIPNWLIASVVALWLAWRLISYAPYARGSGPLAYGAVDADFLGALIFGVAMLGFVAIAERLTGKFMMGGGDIKLLAAVSLFLGIQGVLVALFVACIVSLLYAAANLRRGIPFAPCIMCGTLFASLLA